MSCKGAKATSRFVVHLFTPFVKYILADMYLLISFYHIKLSIVKANEDKKLFYQWIDVLKWVRYNGAKTIHCLIGREWII